MNNISGGMGNQSFKHTPNIQIIANKFELKCMNKTIEVTGQDLLDALNKIVQATKGPIIDHSNNRKRAFETVKNGLSNLDPQKTKDIIDQALKDSAIKEVKEFLNSILSESASASVTGENGVTGEDKSNVLHLYDPTEAAAQAHQDAVGGGDGQKVSTNELLFGGRTTVPHKPAQAQNAGGSGPRTLNLFDLSDELHR